MKLGMINSAWEQHGVGLVDGLRATKRLGLRSFFLRFQISSRDRTWIVLPSPMSSARQAPSPSPDRRWSHSTPAFW